jgi:catechol 2,3-dioxygenase-like lactoylglutathione lyase family enzyme
VSGAEFDAQVTFLHTRDLDACTHFYGTVLGLALVLDQGECRIFRVRSGAYLGFCARETKTRRDGVILTLVTSDVDARCAELADRGVVFEKPPAQNPKFRIYHGFFRDPDGHLLEIQRFEDPAWRET